VLGLCHAQVNGFDLHAAVVVPARDRARLERTCRYALRPPVAHDRIRLTAEGQVLLTLRHRWADGTTHLLFDPIEILERLAAITPRPRINLVLYYGVLGAHAAWRARLSVPATTEPAREPAAERDTRSGEPGSAATSSTQPRSNLLWAQLMQRSFGFDVLACPQCGGRFRLVALHRPPQPVVHIAPEHSSWDGASVAPRQPGRAARFGELQRDLSPGVARTDHQDTSRRQRTRIPILARVQLHKTLRQSAGERRNVRPVICAGRDDHRTRSKCLSVRRDDEPIPVRHQRRDARVQPYRQRKVRDIRCRYFATLSLAGSA
jgi:Putative transposase